MAKTRLTKRKENPSDVSSSSAAGKKKMKKTVAEENKTAAEEKKGPAEKKAPAVKKAPVKKKKLKKKKLKKAAAVEGEVNLPAREENLEDLHAADVESSPREGVLPTAEVENIPAEVENIPAEGNKSSTAAEENEEGEEESSTEEEKDDIEEREEEESDGGGGNGDGEDGDENGGNGDGEDGEESNSTEEEGEARTEAERRNPLNSDSDNESDLMAIKPTKMCFPPTEYKKQIKVGTRCMLADAIKTLENLSPKLSTTERKWFEEHPQFKHLFHMKSRKENHRVQGMWMLLLRTAVTNKKKEVWSVVNGVPIRYGLREHALISGLSCVNYPLNYEEHGSLNFIKRHFKSGESKRLEDVKQKLVTMGPHRDRLKMAVLFFLGSVVCAQTKVGKGAHDVFEFFQKAVEDLEFCKTFPWGRYSYEYMLKQISHTLEHFVEGEGDLMVRKIPDNPKTLWPIPGFCFPLELLAFEAIPSLAMAFRERVEEADRGCPLMCQSTFKKCNGMTGMSLSDIYKELQHETIIHTIIPTRSSKQEEMLAGLMEEEDDRDEDDIAADSWAKLVDADLPIRFEDMFAEDVGAREKDETQERGEGEDGVEGTAAVMKTLKSIMRFMRKLDKKIDGVAKMVAAKDE